MRAALSAPGSQETNSFMEKPKPFTFEVGMVCTPFAFISSADFRISATAKIPMRVVSWLKPARRFALPKVKRAVPSIGAIPMKQNTSPKRPARRPLIIFPEERIATIVRAKKQIPKFSTGVNFSATSASIGAKKDRIKNENSDPRKEKTMPTPSAFIASPFCAIG